MYTNDISSLLWHIDIRQLKAIYCIRIGMMKDILRFQPDIFNACMIYIRTSHRLYNDRVTIYFLEWLYKYKYDTDYEGYDIVFELLKAIYKNVNIRHHHINTIYQMQTE